MQSEIIDALPLDAGARADKPVLRGALHRRFVFAFADAEDPEAFVALDGDTGVVPPGLAWQGRIFWLDPDDTSSAHDGVTVIKTDDDYRYKTMAAFDVRSVLSATLGTPPVSPAEGDAYIVAAGATGAWSAHQDDIAFYTENGWVFEIPVIGRWIHDEEAEGFLRYSSTGWHYGSGARGFDAQSVPLSAALSWGERVIVENQTTTVPPTATKGLRYIVGPAATGAWFGKDAKIAICEVAGTWTFYTPTNGWAAYDKALNKEIRFLGTEWISAVGAIVKAHSVFTAAQANTQDAPGSGASATYDPMTPPTRVGACRYDTVKLTYTARTAGARLRFIYRAECASGAVNKDIVIGLNRDAENLSLDWQRLNIGAIGKTNEPVIFETTAVDTDQHDYWMVFFNEPTGPVTINTVSRRRFSVEEFA